MIQLSLSGAVNGAGNLAAYQVLSGKTKRGITSFNRAGPLTSAVYNPAALTVTLIPRSKLNLSQPERLTVTTSLLTDAFGRPSQWRQELRRHLQQPRHHNRASHEQVEGRVSVNPGGWRNHPRNKLHLAAIQLFAVRWRCNSGA